MKYGKFFQNRDERRWFWTFRKRLFLKPSRLYNRHKLLPSYKNLILRLNLRKKMNDNFHS